MLFSTDKCWLTILAQLTMMLTDLVFRVIGFDLVTAIFLLAQDDREMLSDWP